MNGPKVNTMICVVGAVTRKKKKKICVFYPFGRGVHVAHGVPNFTQPSIPTQPITKGMFKLQSHTPFWIHDHLYFIPPAPGTGSKQQRDKETKRQRDKEKKRKREKTHLCQCPGTERTAAKSPQTRSYHRSERVCTSTPCRLVRQYCVTSSPESN